MLHYSYSLVGWTRVLGAHAVPSAPLQRTQPCSGPVAGVCWDSFCEAWHCVGCHCSRVQNLSLHMGGGGVLAKAAS